MTKASLLWDTSEQTMLKVKDVMRKNVVAVSSFTPLVGLLELIRQTNHRCFPVTEESKFKGMICIEDIMKVFYPYLPTIEKYRSLMPFYKEDLENDLFNVEVDPELIDLLMAEDIMNFDVPTVSEDDDLENVYRTLKNSRLSVLPVVRGDELVGVIGLFDIIYYLLKKKV